MSKKNKKNCPERSRRIVCLGGGTGLSVVLSGLKNKKLIDLSAIVTMFDSGGCSGQQRKKLGILPLGDIRQCLIACSTTDVGTRIFPFRFERGRLKGHSLGNFIIDGATRIIGSLDKAIEEISDNLNVKAKIIPVTLKKADIIAVLKNNKKIKQEEEIINCPFIFKVGVKKLFLEPKVKANPGAIAAIKKADFIVFAPGKFYTSIISNLLVRGVPEAIRKSKAKKVFICNLMTQTGNTDGFSVEDFLTIFAKYLGKNVIDYVVFNTGKLPEKQLKEVKKIFPKANFVKYDKALLKKKNFIGTDLLDKNIKKLNPADIFVKKANQRTMILHNSQKLAKIILKLCKR